MTTTTKDPYALDEKARAQVARMLDLVCKFKRPCTACKRPLWFVVSTKSGKLLPMTDDAVNHFATCTAAEKFRGGK